MGIVAKIVIALLIAGAATAAAFLLPGSQGVVTLYLLFATATVTSALLASIPLRRATPAPSGSPPATAAHTSRTGEASGKGREQGAVKWFNANKGFGFIVRDNGEEIFVHYRNIRGEGRRSLRDGERVSFYIAETEKGPQAEDVAATES